MCRLYGKLDDVTERNSLVLGKGGKSMRKEKKKMSIKRRIAAAALAAEAPAPVAPAAEEPTPEPIVVEEPTIEEAETTDAEETILSVEETEEETEAETEEVTEEETEPETDEDDLLSNNPVIFGLRSANGLMLTAGGAIP